MKKFLPGKTSVFLAVFSILNHTVYSGNPDDINLPSGCTVITVVKGDKVFFGGNDDYINPDSYFWVEQGDSAKYGVVWIGAPDNPQQGINEKRLAYDSNGLPRVEVNPHDERIPVAGSYHHYVMQIMHECATVQEVINWINTHQRHPYMHDQLHFADATGDAVIISPGKDGEMVFTRKDPGDGFLVSTNFNIANPSSGFGYPCPRFDLAQELTGQMLNKAEPLTYADVTNVMDAVHVEGASWTIETMVADLVNGIMYIYYFYQYNHPVVINVSNELSNPRDPGPLSQLFPEEIRQEAARRYKKNQAGLRITKIVGIAWPALAVISVILLFTLTDDYKRLFRFWFLAVLILGPIGLLIRMLVAKSEKSVHFSYALTETLGNIIPTVISCTIAFVILVLKMISGGVSPQLQVLVMFGIPVVAGLLYHAAFLAPVSDSHLFRFILQRLPQVLTTTFLALGGIIPVALPLINKNLNMSLLLPLSPTIVMMWWAVVVLGALLGGLPVFIFERWAVKRDFRSWSVIEKGKGAVRTPAWSKIRWWFPICILVLFAGMIAGVVLAN